MLDPSYLLEVKVVQPVSIEDRQTKQLRGKSINLVKVVWDKRTCDST